MLVFFVKDGKVKKESLVSCRKASIPQFRLGIGIYFSVHKVDDS